MRAARSPTVQSAASAGIFWTGSGSFRHALLRHQARTKGGSDNGEVQQRQLCRGEERTGTGIQDRQHRFAAVEYHRQRHEANAPRLLDDQVPVFKQSQLYGHGRTSISVYSESPTGHAHPRNVNEFSVTTPSYFSPPSKSMSRMAQTRS